jgi:uncharacterized protein YecT (DUF1311 family)
MLFSGLAALALSTALGADCSPTASDMERAACLRTGLEAADRAINVTYGDLRTRLDSAQRLELRDAQRAWIARRDQVCGLATAKGDRAAWLAGLAGDFGKTVCVVRFTSAREAELDARLAALTGRPQTPAASPAPAPQPAPSVAPTPAAAAPTAAPLPAGGAAYDLRAHAPKTTGKWYFEAALDTGRLAGLSEQALFFGVKDPGGGSHGSLITLHRRDVGQAPRNLGIAVDLDAGKLYPRFNGAWTSGAPGSSGGLDLKLGRPYVAWLSSSSALDPGLQIRAVQLNLGQQGFVYALPDGYTPIDPAGAVAVREPG